MESDTIAVARRCFMAFVNSDRRTLEELIGEDFHFTSPLDNRIDRAAYFERCWPNHATITNFEFVRLVADGDEVIVTYDGRNTSGGVFRNTEVLTVRDHKIVNVEVYFGWNLPHKADPGRSVSP